MSLTIALAQINLTVGDIQKNTDKIISTILQAKEQKADLIVFPELAICGYPPEDLIPRKDFLQQAEAALNRIMPYTVGIDALVGLPYQQENHVYNAAAYLRAGKLFRLLKKQKLPNYGVFDEVRYFQPGDEKQDFIFELKNIKLGVLICEDIWYSTPCAIVKQAGAEVILSLNASPFSAAKHRIRTDIIRDRVQEIALPLIYVNQIGGQDELVFDGDSMVCNADGEFILNTRPFVEEVFYIDIEKTTHQTLQFKALPSEHISRHTDIAQHDLATLYQALVVGVRDYVLKNHFQGGIIGLSGGIDSALTLAIAVDALGKDNIQVLLMPSRFTAEMSIEDAIWQAEKMGVNHQTVAIETIVDAYRNTLTPLFKALNLNQIDKTDENIQARTRGNLLMALSNKTGRIVLTTSNKSETAVGYTTLYGDMAGGFCVLKDVYKTVVYQLAHYRNSIERVIPERVITRPPSAELAPNQTDQDSLPPYEVLDQIIELFVEQDLSITDIVNKGFARDTIEQVVRLILLNEHKRRQAPPGPRVTERAFGRNRRFPITSGFDPRLY